MPLVGVLALLWFALRVLPKPSRAAYPCQRAAAPLASAFVIWVVATVGGASLLVQVRRFLSGSRLLAAGLCASAAFLVWWIGAGASAGPALAGGRVAEVEAGNQPVGVARGIHPGRVAWVHDAAATTWDGASGVWWEHVDQDRVTTMAATAVRWVAGESTTAGAWEALFRHLNRRRGRGERGYLPGERIAVKVNMVQMGAAGHLLDPGNAAFNSPQVVYALLRQLVDEAGVAPADITVYDASNFIPWPLFELCRRGDLAAVRFVDLAGGDGRLKAEPDFAAALYHAEPAIPTRYLARAVSESDYVVNLAHLKGHFYAGVTLCGKNHFGSTWVDSGQRFWPGEAIHPYLNAYEWTAGPPWLNAERRPMGSYNPIVEHMGHAELGEKTVLFLVDGLYVPVHQNASMADSPPWQSPPFSGHWTSSLFASQDGVAVDSVCFDFLRSEPTQAFVAAADGYTTADDYLHEAALADDPPSGTFYDPDGSGRRLPSLGVHEHWNNPVDKQYSRNLGRDGGIELMAGPLPGGRTRRAASGRVHP